MRRRRKTAPSRPPEVGFDPAALESAIEQAGLKLAAALVECVRQARERGRADAGIVADAERLVEAAARRGA